LINNWRRDGSIDRKTKRTATKTKRTATIVIVATPVITWLLDAPLWIVVCQIFVLSASATFILTRPSPNQHRP
jgi:uncharacterized membrane protein YbaN (DUF454 family)